MTRTKKDTNKREITLKGSKMEEASGSTDCSRVLPIRVQETALESDRAVSTSILAPLPQCSVGQILDPSNCGCVPKI